MRRVDPHHARAIVGPRVGVLVFRGGRMQHREAHAVPASTTGRPCTRTRARSPARARRPRARRAATMRTSRTGVACMSDSAPPEWSRSWWLTIRPSARGCPIARRNGATMRPPASAVSVKRGAGVVDQRVAARLDDGGEPLPDVEHGEAKRAFRQRRRASRRTAAAATATAERASRHAARREQPQRAGAPRRRRVQARRRVLLPRRIGQRREHLEERASAAPAPHARATKKPSNGMTMPASASGTTHERDERDGHRVGDGRDQRHLLEQRERERREPDRHDPLGVRALAHRTHRARAPAPRRGVVA